MEVIKVFQNVMLQKIQHFDKLVINYSKKLQEHDIELNNQVYKKKKQN